jgi:ATP-dependent 26S proteasome regulatory subunit
MLDGLESESAKRISIMMTTMDIASVPPALVRSGRIELWLETRLPDEQARLDILKERVSSLPEELQNIDVAKVAGETAGLSGADLKRLVEDVKIFYAYDKARQHAIQATDVYFDKAATIIRTNKEKYEKAESERLKVPDFMKYNPMAAFAARHMPDFSSDDDD